MSLTRQHNSLDIPVAGTWTVDPGHAEVAFIGRHFGLTKIRGRFIGVSGTVQIADQPNDSTVNVDIDMATVSSGGTTRDDHLRSPDFFDVLQHPTATFRSTQLRVNGTTAALTGDLTIKSITRPITMDVAFEGAAVDPWGGQRAMFHAEASGLTWNMILEAGGLLVSKEIRLEIDVELVFQTP
jgi:polyisoprenoid-binding protein YceI